MNKIDQLLDINFHISLIFGLYLFSFLFGYDIIHKSFVADIWFKIPLYPLALWTVLASLYLFAEYDRLEYDSVEKFMFSSMFWIVALGALLLILLKIYGIDIPHVEVVE